MRFLQNFWVGFHLNDLKCSCIASHLHFNNDSCILDLCVYYVEIVCVGRIELGWAHDVFTFACFMFMHTYHFVLYLIEFDLCWYFSSCPSLSLSLSLLVALWHLNVNLLRPGTLFILGHLFLILLFLTFSSMMRRLVRTSRRTFSDTTFIWNAKSFYRTFPILTFLLSSIVKVRSHFVASWSLVSPWSYMSFIPICTDLIILYLI